MIRTFQPPPYRLVINATQAAARVAKAALHLDPILVPEPDAERRLSICLRCPGGHYAGRPHQRCMHPKCGCFLAAKARLQTERCPAGHW